MGSTSKIVHHVINYNCIKFGAFTTKPTILSPFCRTTDVKVSTLPKIAQREGSYQPRALSLGEQQRLARLLESNPVTPLRIDRLTSVLGDYDPFLKNVLIQGFSYGFHIHYSNLRSSFESPNLLSAHDQPNIVTDELHNEIEARRVADPFSAPPFDNFVVSPLGIVPKKAPNEFRLIQQWRGNYYFDRCLPMGCWSL